GQGNPPVWVAAKPLIGLELAFKLEPLGALFALMASALWGLNSLYSFGYMRGAREANQTRFYMCFAISMFAVMGIAMAGNLFTLFVFYEVLTFATYPLVAHKGDEASQKAGRAYLAILVGASLTLMLPAIIAVQGIAGSTDFVQGGQLLNKAAPGLAGVLLVMLVFGAAKAALIPVHGWLPQAMVAPTPVSAMLHAVAVVKAGVFTILKLSAYTFGPQLMTQMHAAQYLLWIAGATILIASLRAFTKQNLKARLAWSTIGQLAFVTAAALLPAGVGLVAGGLHMLMHAMAKITLFMCSGAIYVATGAQRVSEMRGLGRRMPIVFGAFLIGALSVAGLPPFGGFWSKFLIITETFKTQHWLVAGVMILSSILSLFYLAPVAVRGLLPPDEDGKPADFIRPGGAPTLAIVPAVITAIACIVLFFSADAIARYLAPIAAPPQPAVSAPVSKP
ncbi:MAG TPA: proton-conducting transporter membrane subunit, partial [Hyphomonadaceae bacterium]|nr:proton-conducting transporter membrane subunit [Hyphomonadaceae bacterium]